MLQTTPAVGPNELVDYWPAVIRAGWFLLGFLTVLILSRTAVEPALDRVLRRRNRNNPTLRDAVRRYVRVLVVLVAVLVGAGVAGYGRFLATSALVIGALTLAIGVAAQEVIGSIVSGIALVFDPEFNVGDHIEWPGGEGDIQAIALRVTRVKTQNGELVTIPNTVLTSEAITRPFGRGPYRIVDDIGIAYEDDVESAIRHLEDVAIAQDGILDDPAPGAYIDQLGDDAVGIRVHYWVADPDRREIPDIRSAYAGAAKARLEGDGFTVGPPSQHDLQGRLGIDKPADDH